MSGLHVLDETAQLAVLVVDDEPVFRKTMSARLSREGMSVTVVGDGLAAVQACETASFDLILMDFDMPVMDGFEATARIARTNPPSNPMIVGCTGNRTADRVRKALKAGMVSVEDKFIDSHRLREIIETARARPDRSDTRFQ
jgi:CheY-like chemotaxis protein